MRILRIATVAVLVLVAATFALIGGYSWLYADHFNWAHLTVSPNSPPDIKQEAAAYDYWRNRGYLYLAAAAASALLAYGFCQGTPPIIMRGLRHIYRCRSCNSKTFIACVATYIGVAAGLLAHFDRRGPEVLIYVLLIFGGGVVLALYFPIQTEPPRRRRAA